jgi:acyl-coenzyme A thioesterase PaaI-like protein
VAQPHSGPAASRLHGWAHRNPNQFRHLLNLWPCFRGTGGRVTYIAPDWSEMRVLIPFNRRTKNYVGTIFGGSLYASVDPHFMFMLIHNLGPDYLVWDKAASIRFRKPGKGPLHASCRLPPGEVEEIRRQLQTSEKVDRTFHVDLVDAAGTVHASVEKIVNVRKARQQEASVRSALATA